MTVIDAEGLRPTPDRVRETLFNWLGQRLDSLRCLDLFAGSGALGFEAASRGAREVVLVERHAGAFAALCAVKEKLHADNVVPVRADAQRYLASLAPNSFDVVFLDPPFGSGLLAAVLPLVASLVSANGAIYVESDSALSSPFPSLSPRQPATAGEGAAEPPAPLGLPPGFFIEKSGKAGAVHYHLLRRGNDRAEDGRPQP